MLAARILISAPQRSHPQDSRHVLYTLLMRMSSGAADSCPTSPVTCIGRYGVSPPTRQCCTFCAICLRNSKKFASVILLNRIYVNPVLCASGSTLSELLARDESKLGGLFVSLLSSWAAEWPGLDTKVRRWAMSAERLGLPVACAAGPRGCHNEVYLTSGEEMTHLYVHRMFEG